MAGETKIGGTNYTISGGKTRVNGTVYSIKGGKTRVNGTIYDISFGTQIGSIPVGSSIYLDVNNVKTEFLVVQQGIPSSIYDESCDGTWLMMRNIYEKRLWNNTRLNDYENSAIHQYLNGEFLQKFEADVQEKILQIKIPYRPGSGRGTTVATGANGLSTKAFLLSCTEIGMSLAGEILPGEGAKLDYFQNVNTPGNSSIRVAQFNGVATPWWLRTPYINQYASSDQVMVVNTNGGFDYSQSWTNGDLYGMRPTIVLPSSFLIKN